jgi:prepilin-type N-terminal cleavage/methylation domain-containing protein
MSATGTHGTGGGPAAGPRRSARERGFTFIEMMAVIAIIAVIAAIVIPNLLSARLSSNETSAIGTLRTLLAAQAAFQKTATADGNGNGMGEYGTFAEMSGAVGVRGGTFLRPPILSTAFREVSARGEVTRHGYQFALFLPDPSGEGLAELPGGGPDAGIDPDIAETTWCCYAWPTNYGSSGVRTFYVSQAGDLVFTDAQAYSGPGGSPDAGAALMGGGLITSITGRVATSATGRDGEFWRPVGR